MTEYENIKESLKKNRRRWLVTGVAGFIGSNLLEELLGLGQIVVGLDNFSTGKQSNLDEVRNSVGSSTWKNFELIKGDIADLDTCAKACIEADFVLHQAALGSVPRSIENPIKTNESNITGFLNMLVAAKDAKVKRFVYAASSSTYGDHPGLPKIENLIGNPLSPYAVTKYVNELYAGVFARTYGMEVIGLRYFNVFGKRQDPDGAYAAVIPKWFKALISGEDVYINGDGETSRDFCYIDNAVQANILSAMSDSPEAADQVYNVAFGQRTSLNSLFEMIKKITSEFCPSCINSAPVYRDFRPGDVRHSLADISKASGILGYKPLFDVKTGLEIASRWYRKNSGDNVVQ